MSPAIEYMSPSAKMPQACIGEGGRNQAEVFLEHLVDMLKETAKPVSLHFNKPD